jgi:putative ABC transport system permease protein
MSANFANQLRLAARSLRASPVFTVAVTLSLALGIGAAGTAFAAFQALVVRPVKYADPQRIVAISTSAKGADQDGVLAPDAEVWRRTARSLAAIATYKPLHVTLTGSGDADELDGASVSADFLRVLSLKPTIGRDFTDADQSVSAEPVVMVSDKLWTERFSRDPRLIGRAIILDGKNYRVIAVAPTDLALPASARFWTAARQSTASGGALTFVNVIARLKPEVALPRARAELSSILHSQESSRPALFPSRLRGLDVIAVPLGDRLFGAARPVLSMLIIAVVALLITACVNAANLLLGRVLARQNEFAIRVALGAGPADLFRTSLAESLLLGFIGGLTGTLLAAVGVFIFGQAATASVAAAQELRFDSRVAIVTSALAAAIALLLAIVPILSVWRASRSGTLSVDVGRTTASRRQQRLRLLFVSAQVAGTLPLIAAAVLMAKSLRNVLALDVGFRHDHLLTVDLRLSRSRYPSAQATEAFFERLVARVRSFPGVESVAFTGSMPLRGIATLEDVGAAPGSKSGVQVAVANVSEAFPAAAGLQLVAGRAFGPGDGPGDELSVLLSSSAAKALFPSGDAVGRRLPSAIGGKNVPPIVIGVVKDVPQLGIEAPPKPQVYLPIIQYGGWPTILVVRASVAPQLLGGSIRQAVAEIDPLQAVRAMKTMDETIDANLAPRRRNVAIVEAFAGIALLLSGIGLYGLVSYQVRLRAKEFGIRIALGAPSTRVLAQVVNQAVVAILPAMLLGLLAAVAASRVLQSFLYGVTGRDPGTLVAAALMLLAAALAACIPGVLRAIRVDPVITLRGG